MPTYDYVCERCDHQFEEFQSITAKPLKNCPKCRKAALRRLIGAGAGVIFKGSGFYQTDYRSEGYKKAADADKPTTESAGSKSETPASAAKSPTTDAKAAEASPSSPSSPAPAGPAASKPPKGKSTRGKSR